MYHGIISWSDHAARKSALPPRLIQAMPSIIPSAPCTACSHPRPPNSGGMFTSFRSSLAAMRSQAQQAGCVTCWILCEGIRHYLEDKQGREDSAYGDVDTVQINLNVASTSARSVEVVLFFETPVTLSFFCEERKRSIMIQELRGIVRLTKLTYISRNSMARAAHARHPFGKRNSSLNLLF